MVTRARAVNSVRMIASLFPPPAGFEDLRLRDAEVSYLRQLPLPAPPQELLARLLVDVPWRAEHIVLWGKRVAQPRLTAWYGDAQRAYRYSGLHLTPLPWAGLLLEIKRAVEAHSGVEFNSVLLNLYRHQRDSMGLHSDDEPELGERPVIASLSLGETRTLVFKHKRDTSLKRVRLPLESGSLLLMQGNTQHCWKHGIDKQTQPCGPRVNLTFRRILG